jgi:hypothetical protein
MQAQYRDTTTGNFTVEDKGINVVSSVGITLVATNERTDGRGGDAFYVLPTCQLGSR